MKRPWALPLVPFYAAGSALRWVGVKPQRLAWPVVSVGSLSAGGAGKTPFVIALAKLAEASGHPVDVLSRGYGRRGGVAVEVDPAGSAESFGDEPLLIARAATVPVFVGAKRFEAGQLAESGAKRRLHLLDDGFQHRQLYRDVDIVLVSSADLDDSLLPAGNRREPLSALRRATVLAVEREDAAANGVLARLRGMQLEQPVWLYQRKMTVPRAEGPVAAFCGIARPEQFFAGLERAGIQVAARSAFRDHHRFTENDLKALELLAQRSGARAFVTTAKDAMRLGDHARILERPLLVADLRVEFADPEAVSSSLRGWVVS